MSEQLFLRERSPSRVDEGEGEECVVTLSVGGYGERRERETDDVLDGLGWERRERRGGCGSDEGGRRVLRGACGVVDDEVRRDVGGSGG